MPERRLPSHAPERRLIAGRGTDERTWNAFDTIERMSVCDVAPWAMTYRRIWLLAPHPDDEVLALGGSLARLSALDADLCIVSVTDGEASHDSSAAWPPSRLAQTRPAEMRRGLEALGIESEIMRLGLPDGRVSAHREQLFDALMPKVGKDDLLLATCRFDGHPDHEACGDVAVSIAQQTGATVFEYPVWMWHWASPHEPLVPWCRARRLPLEATTVGRKRDAIGQFHSQLEPDGERPPVLPAHVLPRFTRPFEVVFT